MIGCLALYDFDVKEFKLKEWVDYAEQWMTTNGYPPNTMGIPPSRKYLLYKNGKKKLEKDNYGKEYLSIYGGGEPGTNRHWTMAAYFSEYDRTTYLCFDEKDIAFSYEILEQLLIDLCNFCSPKYGIGYLREKKYGPDYYAFGMSHGLKLAYENEEHGKEDDRITKWIDVYRRNDGYKTGDLRDVYPFNVLSQEHLDRMVNGIRFEDWVKESQDRGQLKKVSDTVWTWWLETDPIPGVRDALAPSGMILCL